MEKVQRPTWKTDHVLIRVQAAGVNPIDWRIRSGSMRWILLARLPLILGFDVAGQIVEAGAEAQQRGWNPDNEVLSFLDSRHGGGYAEYAVATDATSRAKSSLSHRGRKSYTGFARLTRSVFGNLIGVPQDVPGEKRPQYLKVLCSPLPRPRPRPRKSAEGR